MKKFYLSFMAVILGICLFTSIAWSAAAPLSAKPGYVMFRDSDQDMIHSDGSGVYKDCSLGGTDMVKIRVLANGSSSNMELYFGVMEKQFYTCDIGQWSSRRLKFNFNVSGITGSEPTGSAVRDILRWYKDKDINGDDVYKERSATPGHIDDGSLHVPIAVNIRWISGAGDDQVQFAIDPVSNTIPAGSDTRVVTQGSVDSYYDGDTDQRYFCTRAEPNLEPFPYVVYVIDYGDNGFDVKPIAFNKAKKPVTWIVKTKTGNSGDLVRLFVVKDEYWGEKVYLTSYSSLPFEFAVSLNPISAYPTTASPAPPRSDNVSATWGEIKNGQ